MNTNGRVKVTLTTTDGTEIPPSGCERVCPCEACPRRAMCHPDWPVGVWPVWPQAWEPYVPVLPSIPESPWPEYPSICWGNTWSAA